MYCSNIARTFLVDPPKKVSETYEVLLEVQEACMSVMKPGKSLKMVYKTAVSFLQQRTGFEHLAEKLPKNLGFAMGLDFREPTMLLSEKNKIAFKPGMVFCLSIGFHDVELSEADRSSTPDNSAVSFCVIVHHTLYAKDLFIQHALTFPNIVFSFYPAGQKALQLFASRFRHGGYYQRQYTGCPH
jgi:nucleosome binding factor SPN SPT16 subunit